MARGQEPDAELTARFEKFQKDVNGHDAYQEAQRLAQHEAWKVDLEERKKKKAEEAAQTAAGWPSEETPF